MAKFDVWNHEFLKHINNPFVCEEISFNNIYSGLKKFRQEFKGDLELQIMFTEENKDGYDNSFDFIKNINPDRIQINTPLRPCDINPLKKEKIDQIKQDFEIFFNPLNIKVSSVYDKEKKIVDSIDKKATEIRRGKE